MKETEYEKLISDSQKLLDSLYLEYETILNMRLDNLDNLINQMILEINTNASTIGQTLTTEATNVGTVLSDSMKSIWLNGDGNIKSIMTVYGNNFDSKLTTINTTLNGISTKISNMTKETDKKAQSNISSSSSNKKPSSSSTANKPATPTKPKTGTGSGTPEKGDKVTFVSGRYYYDSYGKSPLGSKYQGKQVYITNINKKGSHPYHISTGSKLGSGDLGWLKLNQISGYATGKRNINTNEFAWTQEGRKSEFIVRPSDGAILTPIAKGDSVLNANASANIWKFANNPVDFIRDNLDLGIGNVPNNSSIQSNYTQNLENVVFNLPNVQNYGELLSTMQKDKSFEKLIQSMTIDRVAGKSSLAKNKVIR